MNTQKTETQQTNKKFERKFDKKEKKEQKEDNPFTVYANKVISFRLDYDRNINAQFEDFKKMCSLTSKYNHFRYNLSIDNYMVIINKVIEKYIEGKNKNDEILYNFYWDIMINFISSVKSIYMNILKKRDGPKYINETTLNFTMIIKKCCVSKSNHLKYKNQSGFLNMTRGLVGWSIDDRRELGDWLKEMKGTPNKNDKKIEETKETETKETETKEEIKDDVKNDKEEKPEEKIEDKPKEEEKDDKKNKKGRKPYNKKN